MRPNLVLGSGRSSGAIAVSDLLMDDSIGMRVIATSNEANKENVTVSA